jgi:hypothetical protein
VLLQVCNGWCVATRLCTVLRVSGRRTSLRSEEARPVTGSRDLPPVQLIQETWQISAFLVESIDAGVRRRDCVHSISGQARNRLEEAVPPCPPSAVVPRETQHGLIFGPITGNPWQDSSSGITVEAVGSVYVRIFQTRFETSGRDSKIGRVGISARA